MSYLQFQRNSMDSRIIIPLFSEFIQTISKTWEIIATDAWKSYYLTTIAGFSSAGQCGYKIHQVNSIFTAEVLAIAAAFDELIYFSHPVIILKNILSVLLCLQSINLNKSRDILKLKNKIQRAADHIPNIHFDRVPRHWGIPQIRKMIVSPGA